MLEPIRNLVGNLVGIVPARVLLSVIEEDNQEMLKKRSLWSIAGGLLLLTTMVLSACGPTSTSTGGGNNPVSGGTVIDGISQEPSSLLPQLSTQTFADLVDTTIWAPLFYSNDKAGISAGLATQVPSTSNGGISADGKTYTFKLRSGLKWSDNQPLTADDVVWTINLFKDPKYGTKDAFPGAEIDSAVATDPQTVTITLNKVDAAFLALGFTDAIAFTPLPKHAYSSMTPGDLAKSQEGFKPTISSGPFIVSERVQGDHVTVKKNPNYYIPGRPYLDSIVFKVFADSATIVTALQGGQIDTAFFLPVSSYDTLSSIQGYKLVPATVASNFEAWYLNTTSPVLQDVNVREALAISFDTKLQTHQIWHDLAHPTCDEAVGTFAHDAQLIDSGGYCAYGPDGKSFDNGGVAAANSLLDTAGWKLNASTGYREKNGKELDVRISTTAKRKYREDSEALAQAAWKAIGVKLVVKNYPSGDLFGPILFPSTGTGNNAYDIGEFETGPGVDPDNRSLYNSAYFPQAGGGNLMFYKNTDVDNWTTQQVTVANQNDRKALFTQIHTQVNKDVPVIWLYSVGDLCEYNLKIHNYAPSGEGPSETWNAADWWLTNGGKA